MFSFPFCFNQIFTIILIIQPLLDIFIPFTITLPITFKYIIIVIIKTYINILIFNRIYWVLFSSYQILSTLIQIFIVFLYLFIGRTFSLAVKLNCQTNHEFNLEKKYKKYQRYSTFDFCKRTSAAIFIYILHISDFGIIYHIMQYWLNIKQIKQQQHDTLFYFFHKIDNLSHTYKLNNLTICPL